MSEASNAKLNIALLTVSDTRTVENDTSGNYLQGKVLQCEHKIASREIVKDDIYAMRAIVSQWISDPAVNAIITTGGTGFTFRDSTPEALTPLFDKTIDGFGELFRQLSFDEIGNSTVQSRAIAGLANNTVIFCLPGSTNACRLGWEKIISDQLNANHKPCNFAELILKKSQSH